MASAERTPLQHYLPVQGRLDRLLSAILSDAAVAAGETVASLGDGVAAEASRVRLRETKRQLERQSTALWSGVGTETADMYGPAAVAAAESGSAEARAMFDAMGLSIPEYHAAKMLQAVDNVPALIARGYNNIPLAESVYGAKNLADGYVDQTINRGILLGKSAKEIAKDVTSLIRPDVPGGVSYSAMRLGRTELNNAFHRSYVNLHQDEPWVVGMRWHLSGSHPRPDDCNKYADEAHFKGGEPGVFRADEVPGKPHPQCLCYVTTVQVSEDEFMDSLINGDYDKHLKSTIDDSDLTARQKANGDRKVDEIASVTSIRTRTRS